MAAVDVAFGLTGNTVPRDHGYLLFCALARELAWLEEENRAGVHTITGPVADDEHLFITRRTRLVLRLPQERVQDVQRLSGARLDVGGELMVGEAHLRPFVPHDTLYARLVATNCDREPAFEQELTRELDEAGIRCGMICGQGGEVQLKDGAIRGRSVLLHGLTPDDSLRMQQSGLGAGRKLGCGLFTPHKSVKAVGT